MPITQRMNFATTLTMVLFHLGAVAALFMFNWKAFAVAVFLYWFCTGLGIGGLAVAFAAQDTIANLFGSFVVVLDHPFKVGDYVRIGSAEGIVEDIGLRSTRLRSSDRTQIVLPNKTAAAETIVNFTRMPQRRVDQKLGLTYSTTPEQMEAVLVDLRHILAEDAGVHQGFVVVNFTDYNASSLDISVTYFAADPDFRKHLAVRERINLKIMRAGAARGLAFAFPTQTLHVEDDVARKLAGVRPGAGSPEMAIGR